MNRVIKFRAWNKQDKKMLQWGSGIISIDHHLNVSSVPYNTVFDHNQVELMQFTGLLDKNKVEVYEGDILGLDDSEDHSRALVVFDSGAFKVKLLGTFRSPVYAALYGAGWEDWIIIGNVYENPEMLERSKEVPLD